MSSERLARISARISTRCLKKGRTSWKKKKGEAVLGKLFCSTCPKSRVMTNCRHQIRKRELKNGALIVKEGDGCV